MFIIFLTFNNIQNELLRLEIENYNSKILEMYETPKQVMDQFDLNMEYK